jgi:Big-like domain-containing protein
MSHLHPSDQPIRRRSLRRTALTLVLALLGSLVSLGLTAGPAAASNGVVHMTIDVGSGINGNGCTDCGPNPSKVGQSVHIAVGVRDDSTSCETFGDCDSVFGTIDLYDGTVKIASSPLTANPNCEPCASFTDFNPVFTGEGDHNITAKYVPGNFEANQIGYVQHVEKFSTATALFQSSSASVGGQPVTLTARVSVESSSCPAAPGQVQFFDGGVAYGNPVSVAGSAGEAALTTTTLSSGTHGFTARYLGNTCDAQSVSVLVSHSVSPGATTTVLTSDANPSTFGQAVTFSAGIFPVSPAEGSPSGSVSFYDGPALLGSATIINHHADFTTSALSVGHHSITSVYGDNDTYKGNTSAALDQVVNKAPTTTSVTSSQNPSTFGQSVTFTATATGTSATPTGTFAFFADGVGISGCATQAMTSGRATCATSSLTVGNHAITATYSGDGTFVGSTGSLLNGQTVTKAPTSTALTVAPNPSTFGRALTVTATVNPTSPNSTAPTGTVSFFLDGAAAPVATLPLSGNQASFTTAGLGAGPHSLVAIYNGDSNFLGSTSPAAPATVNPGSTVSGTISGNVIVPAGGSVLIKNASVSGSVIVQAGGAVDIENSTVTGSVSASSPAALRMCGTTVSGSTGVSNATGLVVIGDTGKNACAVNTIAGGLTLTNNHGGVVAKGNHVRGTVSASGNTGPGAFPGDGTDISGNGP